MDHPSTNRRKLTAPERKLLKKLIENASALDLATGWEKNLLVEPLSDGGMGSLKLIPSNAPPYRKLGGAVSRLEFEDTDGVKVSVVLNVDQSGQLFELDIWKADFSPLTRLP